jgi:hypothetical protein
VSFGLVNVPADLRRTVASLLGDRTEEDAARIAEAFVALCVG